MSWKKRVVAILLVSKDRIFTVYVASFAFFNKIFSFQKIQIILLKIDRDHTTVFLEYSEFADVFSPERAIKPLKHMKINNDVIDMIDGK